MFGVVYMATNTKNGKVYIGQTTQPLHRRVYQHLNDLCCANDLWRKAVKKYGKRAFVFKPLDYAKTAQSLHAKEMKWIRLLRTNEPEFGYNARPVWHKEEVL